MDFTETSRVRELSEKVWRFMDERVRPAEEEYWSGFSAETIPQRISPVMEDLKAEARRRGLWNLFLPDKRFGAGLTNPEIAERLYLSNHTVKTHINRIFAKTGSRDRAAAIGYARRHNIG